MRIFSALNVESLTSEVERAARRPWGKPVKERSLILRTSSAPLVVLSKLMTAKNMVSSLFHSNVDSVALWLNGFAGETRIFATSAIRSKSLGSMSLSCLRIGCQNAKAGANAQWEDSTAPMGNNTRWAVAYAEGKR